jgi:hypothetical protein
MSTELEYLELDPRLYEYIRKTAIKNIDDALLELITNSIDAYNSINSINRLINIDVNRKEGYLIVRDQATGLTGEKMKNCFLKVGGYNANNGSRGYFSRGAKDISSLGDITFTCIKDGIISQCIIYSDTRYEITKINEIITDDIRAEYKILENGIEVKVEFTKKKMIQKWRNGNLIYHYALRDIFANRNNEIYLNIDSAIERLQYTFPEGEKLVDFTYILEKFNCEATFTLYKNTSGTLNKSSDARFNEEGILFSSNVAIYDQNMLWDKYIRRHNNNIGLFGRIHCNHIKNIQLNYETESDELNPFPIIDPSRMSGIQRWHPFTVELIKLPTQRMYTVLANMEHEKTHINLKAIGDLFNNFNELEEFAIDIFNNIIPPQLQPVENRQNIVKEDKTGKYSSGNIDNQQQENKQKQTVVNISVVDELGYPYDVYYNENGIFINVNEADYKFKKFIGTKEDNYQYINTVEARLVLANIVTEAFSEILSDKELLDTDLTEKTNEDIITVVDKTYCDCYSKVADKINKIFLDTDANLTLD